MWSAATEPEAYRESEWPYQYIGSCARCGRGIRCNDQADVKKFINRHKACWQGVSKAETDG